MSVLSPPAWLWDGSWPSSPLVHEPSLGTSLLPCWIWARAGLGTLQGGDISRLWAMPHGERLPSAESLALKYPLLASPVLLLAAASLWGLGLLAVLEWDWQEAAHRQCCPVSWWMAPDPQQSVVHRDWDLGPCGRVPDPVPS